MRELDIEEVKKLSLEVLCEIHEICQKNNITYSLTGGTLLGAIRHKGFIPWDDDIDVTMPRPDYSKFLEYVREHETMFEFVSREVCGNKYPYLCGKAYHKDTVLIENGVKNNSIPMGVYVDIFPVDGVGNNKLFASLQCEFAQILNGLRITSNWTVYQKSSRSNKMFGIIRYMCYRFSKIIGLSRIDYYLQKNISRYDFKKSKYAARLGANLRQSCIQPIKVYEKVTMAEFENKLFCVFEEYDQYLTKFFGDYMELPAQEKRVRHHNYIAYTRCD